MTLQRTAHLELGHDVSAPRSARGFVSSVLDEWGIPAETVERSRLLVSELVSNAVLHGGGPIDVDLCEQDPTTRLVRVEVRNRGNGAPVLRRARPGDVSGRGLHLIDELAAEWGTRSGGGHTIVWFEVAPASS